MQEGRKVVLKILTAIANDRAWLSTTKFYDAITIQSTFAKRHLGMSQYKTVVLPV